MERGHEVRSPELDRFVGREAELSELASIFARGARLVVITGPPGIGKSRLARRFASGAPGVELVDGMAPGDPRITTTLRELAARPELRVLASAHAPLGVTGEVTLVLGPLELATPGDDPRTSDAVELLLDRVRALAGPELDPPAAAGLARALGGVPSALELAARRLVVLPPEVVRDEAERGYEALDRTMAAALASVPEPARRGLASLAVLEGGFDFAAAEAVVASGHDVVATLGELHPRGLVAWSEAESRRHHVAPHVRRAALSLSEESGEVAAARARHLRWFAREAELRGAGRDALAWATRERDNLLAAARHGLGPGADPEAWAAGMTALLALEDLVRVSGLFGGARATFDAAIARAPSDLHPRLTARALAARALLRHHAGDAAGADEDTARVEALVRAHDVSRRSALGTATDGAAEAVAWAGLARRAAMLRARFQRLTLGVDGAVAAWEALLPGLAADPAAECEAWFELGCLEQERTRYTLAYDTLGRALERARAHGLLALEIAIHVRLVENLLEQDRPEAAQALVATALGLVEPLADPRVRSTLLAARGLAFHLAGELARARADYQLAHDLGDTSPSESNTPLLAAIGLGLVALEAEGPVGARRAFERVLRLAARGAPAQSEAARWIVDVALAPVDDPRRRTMMTMIDAVLDKSARHWRRYARLGLKLLERQNGPRVAPEPRLALEPPGPGWQTFVVEPGGPRVSLARRAVLRRVLDHLVRVRRDAPGRATTLDELSAAGWPNEQVHPDAMASRVYVALSTLRRLGLGPWLVNNGDGYLLTLALAG